MIPPPKNTRSLKIDQISNFFDKCPKRTNWNSYDRLTMHLSRDFYVDSGSGSAMYWTDYRWPNAQWLPHVFTPHAPSHATKSDYTHHKKSWFLLKIDHSLIELICNFSSYLCFVFLFLFLLSRVRMSWSLRPLTRSSASLWYTLSEWFLFCAKYQTPPLRPTLQGKIHKGRVCAVFPFCLCAHSRYCRSTAWTRESRRTLWYQYED